MADVEFLDALLRFSFPALQDYFVSMGVARLDVPVLRPLEVNVEEPIELGVHQGLRMQLYPSGVSRDEWVLLNEQGEEVHNEWPVELDKVLGLWRRAANGDAFWEKVWSPQIASALLVMYEECRKYRGMTFDEMRAAVNKDQSPD